MAVLGANYHIIGDLLEKSAEYRYFAVFRVLFRLGLISFFGVSRLLIKIVMILLGVKNNRCIGAKI